MSDKEFFTLKNQIRDICSNINKIKADSVELKREIKDIDCELSKLQNDIHDLYYDVIVLSEDF